MGFIYRRFFIVGLFIAAFAGITANIIVNTKTQRADVTHWKVAPIQGVQNETPKNCDGQKWCFSLGNHFQTYG